MVDKKVFAPNFKKQSKERESKIKKKPGIAPNSYDFDSSFNKTQVVIRNQAFLKCKRFVDDERELKRRAFVPPPGHYSIDEAEKKAYKRFGPQRR